MTRRAVWVAIGVVALAACAGPRSGVNARATIRTQQPAQPAPQGGSELPAQEPVSPDPPATRASPLPEPEAAPLKADPTPVEHKVSTPAAIDSGTPTPEEAAEPAPAEHKVSTPAAIDSDTPTLQESAAPTGGLQVGPGEPLPAPVELEGRTLACELVPSGQASVAAGGSAVRVRVLWSVEPSPPELESIGTQTLSVVDVFATPSLLAAPTKWAGARVAWSPGVPEASGGTSVPAGCALAYTLRADTTQTPAATSRMRLLVEPSADATQLDLGLEVSGPGATGGQVHEFVRLRPGPSGSSCRLWLPDLLSAGRRSLGGFRVEVELVGWAPSGTPAPVFSQSAPLRRVSVAGDGEAQLDVSEPRRALHTAAAQHPLLADLAASAPSEWLEHVLAEAPRPTANGVATSAWNRLTAEAPPWAASICARYAGALALRPSRLAALLAERPPEAWQAAIEQANFELLKDSYPNVRLRAARFLRGKLPPGYDPLNAPGGPR